MAEQNARQRTKHLHSMESRSQRTEQVPIELDISVIEEYVIIIIQAASHQVQPTVQYFKAGQTYFFKRDQSSDEGNQEETIGDGTNIHLDLAIKNCRNSNAFGPHTLSIFHLKHLGPRAIECITTIFNLSVTTWQIPAIWKSSLIIPIPKPGKDTSQGTSYRPISLLGPAAKFL